MKESNNIQLERLDYKDQNKILDLINSDSDLKKTFSGGRNTMARLLNTDYAAFIKKENKTIGFIMLVNNGKTNKYEVDIGILKAYRKKGYGSEALSLLKKIIKKNKLNIEIQIKKNNIAAIKSVLNNGFSLIRDDNMCNYYVLLDNKKNR